MAKKFVSPGVFTTEIDQSFLATGLNAIGAAVIGRTLKGPAFKPTVVTDFTEFQTKFGDLDPTMMVPYAAQAYLKNASTLTVVRVLGTKASGQYGNVSNGSQLNLFAIAGSGSDVLAIVAVKPSWSGSVSGTGTNFGFSFTSGAASFAGTASFNTGSSNYVAKVFNGDPTQIGTYGHFLYKCFQWAGSGTGAPFTLVALSGTTTASFDQEYLESQTPWVRSQAFGSNYFNLFKFHTLGAGAASTNDIKVSITNIKTSLFPSITPYGTFDVVIRAFGDNDSRPVTVESFAGCDLNPKSQNYVARRIGDQYISFDSNKKKNLVNGTYKNASAYVRVEMATGNTDATALPWGHTAYPENTISSGVIVDVPFVLDNLDASSNVVPSTTWGIDFSQAGIADRLKALASPGAQVTGSVLDLAHVASTSSAGYTWLVYDTGSAAHVPTTASENGFTMACYGGFDGFDVTLSNPLDNTACNASNTYIGTVSQKFGVDMVANPDEIDLNLLALPGTTAPKVVDYARQVCNERADVMFIMDIEGSSVNDAIGVLNNRSIDDNYTACYYPDLKLSDNVNNVIVQVKPSTIMLGVYAFSDRVGQVFFAPAGLNRGGLNAFGVTDVVDRLTHEDRNDLYEARINPIATFPNEGIVAFGQKTLQQKPSALDRVNVRRLLIYSKKTIASAAKLLLFEPNNPSTWNRFLNTVNPILEKIRQDQGLERFKVVMDSTVNTPDVVDRNIMRGKIFLQPTKSAEYIDLQFVITASGVSFEE